MGIVMSEIEGVVSFRVVDVAFERGNNDIPIRMTRKAVGALLNISTASSPFVARPKVYLFFFAKASSNWFG